MKVRIKKLNGLAVVPSYAHDGEDACFDLVATSKTYDGYGNVVYGFGLAFEIPKGYVGLLFPRSSVYKKAIAQTNAVGVIDSGYRGEVMAKFKPMPIRDDANVYAEDCLPVREYEVGERCVQMMILPYPHIEFEVVEELNESERGEGGHGSTGN